MPDGGKLVQFQSPPLLKIMPKVGHKSSPKPETFKPVSLVFQDPAGPYKRACLMYGSFRVGDVHLIPGENLRQLLRALMAAGIDVK